jgi:flagellar hook-associated protein 2
VLSLPQIGIEFQKDGTLSMDSTKFNAALAKSSDDIAGLFSTFGKATDSLVTFSSSTTATKAGNYPVTVTQLATHGSLIGSVTPTTPLTIAANSALSVTLDGTSAVVQLVEGTYDTPAKLASMLQSAPM